MELRVRRWGNSLALRLPARMAKQLRLNEGAKIRLSVDQSGQAILTPARAFGKALYLRRVRALVRGMPMSDAVVREMRDDARY